MRKLVIAAVAVIIIWGLFGLYVVVLEYTDAPPIPNDYTMADLRSAPGECNESYYVLMKLAETRRNLRDAPAIGLTAEDVNTTKAAQALFKDGDFPPDADIIPMAARIEQAWEDGRKGREVVAELGKFAQVADLTDPGDLRAEGPVFGTLINVGQLGSLYEGHILLQLTRGNDEAAASELIEFDSALRKLAPNARLFTMKGLCNYHVARDMRMAAYVASKASTSKKTITLLGEHFAPLTETWTSWRNIVVFQYLRLRANADDIGKSPRFFKRNSTLRAYRNILGLNKGVEFNVCPSVGPEFVKISEATDFPWIYKRYNMGGVLLMSLFYPPERYIMHKSMMECGVNDDMLQIALARKLGKPYSLKARAYSDEYVIDANAGRIVSPGPDGKMGTKDDIWLPICVSGSSEKKISPQIDADLHRLGRQEEEIGRIGPIGPMEERARHALPLQEEDGRARTNMD